jgi:hypothetical protein
MTRRAATMAEMMHIPTARARLKPISENDTLGSIKAIAPIMKNAT